MAVRYFLYRSLKWAGPVGPPCLFDTSRSRKKDFVPDSTGGGACGIFSCDAPPPPPPSGRRRALLLPLASWAGLLSGGTSTQPRRTRHHAFFILFYFSLRRRPGVPGSFHRVVSWAALVSRRKKITVKVWRLWLLWRSCLVLYIVCEDPGSLNP